MKIYMVFKNTYLDPQHMLKTFLDLNKAIDYAADFVMTKTDRYERDYIKKTMIDQYDESTPISCIFLYTQYYNTSVDEYVGIREIDVDEPTNKQEFEPPELGVAKALSIDPNDIITEAVESIGVCYKCKKPIKDWGEGGINSFSMKPDGYYYTQCQTVLLCSDCGWNMRKLIMDFIYTPIDEQ